jgi:hypothetical protein
MPSLPLTYRSPAATMTSSTSWLSSLSAIGPCILAATTSADWLWRWLLPPPGWCNPCGRNLASSHCPHSLIHPRSGCSNAGRGWTNSGREQQSRGTDATRPQVPQCHMGLERCWRYLSWYMNIWPHIGFPPWQILFAEPPYGQSCLIPGPASTFRFCVLRVSRVVKIVALP